MFKSRRIFCLIINIAIIYKFVSCDCERTIGLCCDRIEDLKSFTIDQSIETEELTVGPKQYEKELPPPTYKLSMKDLLHFLNLKRLVIIQQLNGIDNRLAPLLGFKKSLKNLIFYRNNLEKIGRNTFDEFSLDRLSLENNNIEKIDTWAFTYSRIDVLDLSNNKITLINHPIHGCVIKKLLLNNNEMIKVEPKSFPGSLQVLRLDYNNLNVLDDELLADLKNVSVLSISHNNLTQMIRLPQENVVEKLDVSYNNLSAITDDDLTHLKKLIHLNLEGNKLTKFSLKPFQNGPARKKLLQLSYNQLSFIDFTVLRTTKFGANYSVVLHENPWHCQCLSLMEYDLRNISVVHLIDCEFEINGKQPICTMSQLSLSLRGIPFQTKNYDLYREHCVSKQAETNKFSKIISKSKCTQNFYGAVFFNGDEKFLVFD